MAGKHSLALVYGEHRTFGEHRQVFVGYDRGNLDDEVRVRLQTGHLKIDPNEILGEISRRVFERAKPHGSRATELKGKHGSGVVLASYGRGVLVQSDTAILHCALKGRKQRIVCGDRVAWAYATVGRRSDGRIDRTSPQLGRAHRCAGPRRTGCREHRPTGHRGGAGTRPGLVPGRPLLGGRASEGYRGHADRQQVGPRHRLASKPSWPPIAAWAFAAWKWRR